MFLMDTGVLFAAIYRSQSQHPAVLKWLASIERHASCGMTQIGTFRLLLNPKVMSGQPLPPAMAHEVLADFIATERHPFLACPPISDEVVGQTSGHNAAADDYLVQVATAAGCKLATLDHALATRWPEHTFLIS